MKQIYQFASSIFSSHLPKKERRYLHTICQDSDGCYFIKTPGIGEKNMVCIQSECKDFVLFEIENGLFVEDCKIYLN